MCVLRGNWGQHLRKGARAKAGAQQWGLLPSAPLSQIHWTQIPTLGLRVGSPEQPHQLPQDLGRNAGSG